MNMSQESIHNYNIGTKIRQNKTMGIFKEYHQSYLNYPTAHYTEVACKRMA